tara:strand:+ start:2001 stop:2588 length:588 start_codon:yes stop_codon:yes gene_type:complete
MALITMPSSPSFTQSSWSIKRSVAGSRSPFSGHEQVYEYSMACWQATVTLPPMKRSQAGAWQAFFLKLRGRANTFLMGDPDGQSNIGTATTVSITSGTHAIGDTTIPLTLDGTLKAGDYVQFGTGASSQLHMIVADRSGSGTATIEPSLKVAINTSTPASISDTTAVMRMDSNDLGWDADHVSKYGFSFSCTEAL